MSEYDEQPPIVETEKNNSKWNHDTFRDRIVEAAADAKEIAVSELPDEIDLTGIIGSKCDELVEKTDKKELGTYTKVSTNKKLLLSNQIVEGTETNVGMSGALVEEVDIFAPQYSRSESMAMTMHTHPVERPPSPTDVSGLLVDTEDGGEQAAIVLCKGTRYLLIRTVLTPSMSHEEAEKWAQGQNTSLEDDVSGESRRYQDFMNKKVGGVSRDKLEDHLHRYDIKNQMQNLHKMLEEQNIAIYVATGDNRYTTEAADHMRKLYE